MRANFVVVAAPPLDDRLAPARARAFEAQALVAELALEALNGAILPRLMSGSINAAPMSCAIIRDKSIFDTYSGPLSLRRNFGAPRSLTSRESTSITLGERMRPSTSITSPV